MHSVLLVELDEKAVPAASLRVEAWTLMLRHSAPKRSR